MRVKVGLRVRVRVRVTARIRIRIRIRDMFRVRVRVRANLSIDTDRTNETCTPRDLCRPEHSRHIKTPNETEAHWGDFESQSQQVLLPAMLRSSSSTALLRQCAIF